MTGGGPDGDAGHGFDFLAEPVLVVTPDGRILEANTAARAHFGAALADARLDAVMPDASGDFARHLRLAAGSTAPRPGKFVFAGANGPEAFITHAARSRRNAPETQIILRLSLVLSDRFAMLTRRVRDLDAKLLVRLRENAALGEALRQRGTLLRELQHRVKNNIQLMMSLIAMSAGGHDAPEVAAVVETARGRLQAMAAAQEALYQANDVDTVHARSFLEDVVRTSARSNGVFENVSLSFDDADLSSEEAHCLALIANELITNAAKHGLRDGRARIAVTFVNDGGECGFRVEDDGPGMPAQTQTRSSGLALVRGLCRQIGGRLDIDGGEGMGTRCSVRFRGDRRRKEVA